MADTKSIAVPWVAFALETVLIGSIVVILRTFCNSQDNGVMLTLGIALALSAGLAAMASRPSFKKNEAMLHLLYIAGALVLVSLALYKYFYPKYCIVAGSNGKMQQQKKKSASYGDVMADAKMVQQQAAMAAEQTAIANKYSSLLGPGGTQDKSQSSSSSSSSGNDGTSTTPSNNSSLGYGICFCLLTLHFYFGLFMGIDKIMAMTGS